MNDLPAADIAEGRRLYAAALDTGMRRVELVTEGGADATTNMLIWSGNNLPALLDAAEKVAAIKVLAERWANQSNDYDEDTEQQIEDGREILVLLGEEADSGE